MWWDQGPALSISRNNIKILISLVEKSLTRKQSWAFRQCTRGHKERKTKLPTTVWQAVHCQGLPVQGHRAGLLNQPLWWHPLDRYHPKGLTWQLQQRNTTPEFQCWLLPHRPVPKNAVGSINKQIISWFLTQQPYQEEPYSSQRRTETNTAPVLLTDSSEASRAPAQRQITVLPSYRNFLIGRPTN